MERKYDRVSPMKWYFTFPPKKEKEIPNKSEQIKKNFKDKKLRKNFISRKTETKLHYKLCRKFFDIIPKHASRCEKKKKVHFKPRMSYFIFYTFV